MAFDNMRCCHCKKDKPEIEFGWKNESENKIHAYCKVCKREYNKKWYKNKKDSHIKTVRKNSIKYRNVASQFVWNYKLSHPCIDCGENDPIVLEFDHIFGIKKDHVSKIMGVAKCLDALKKEIEKCEVVCANCHKRRTAKRSGYYKNITL